MEYEISDDGRRSGDYEYPPVRQSPVSPVPRATRTRRDKAIQIPEEDD